MGEIDRASFQQRTRDYYRKHFAEHGATPRGVAWNGVKTQETQFDQLLKILPSDRDVAIDINDFGCGYGALVGYLAARRRVVRYRGYDLNEPMIAAARDLHPEPVFEFYVADAPLCEADYGVASGIFTLRLGRCEEECWQALLDGAAALHRTSRRGFAFNCLTTYSDEDRKEDYLFYPDPCAVFHHCKTNFSRDVALLHDYGTFGFTILVRKDVE